MTAFPGAEFILFGIFVSFVLASVAGALIAASSRRVIRGVCGLALCCFGVAGLYYFLHSPLLALMEILIYVGAVCVTIVFAVMLTEPDEPPRQKRVGPGIAWGVSAIVVGVASFCAIWRLGVGGEWKAPPVRVTDASVEAVGTALLTTYSLAFELISLVLLVAILGALVIAHYGRTNP
jgi:NADH:ubiquinone oxidoreductase subunit 6 (subunit J)